MAVSRMSRLCSCAACKRESKRAKSSSGRNRIRRLGRAAATPAIIADATSAAPSHNQQQLHQNSYSNNVAFHPIEQSQMTSDGAMSDSKDHLHNNDLLQHNSYGGGQMYRRSPRFMQRHIAADHHDDIQHPRSYNNITQHRSTAQPLYSEQIAPSYPQTLSSQYGFTLSQMDSASLPVFAPASQHTHSHTQSVSYAAPHSHSQPIYSDAYAHDAYQTQTAPVMSPSYAPSFPQNTTIQQHTTISSNHTKTIRTTNV